MIAVLTGLLLIVAAYFFDRYSARQHRVLSALCGAALFAVAAFFLTAQLGTTWKIAIIALSALAGGALMTWLLVTGIFIGGVFLAVLLAYAFVFVFPLPIPTLYWGYIALFLGICAVWKKHLAAQALECTLSGLLTAVGGGLVISRSFGGFFGIFADPTAHTTENLVLFLSIVILAVGYGVYRIKTHRLEEVK